MAVDTLKRLSGPTLLTAVAATQYTVPAATTTSVRNIHAANNTTQPATFTLSIGADAAGTRFFPAVTVQPNDVYDWQGLLVLNPAEIVQAYSGTASALILTMSGIETA